MEAINSRLRQLEDIETTLYVRRQAIIQQRLQEDENMQTKRQMEDQAFSATLVARDDEEDVSTSQSKACFWKTKETVQELRQRRRKICRASFLRSAEIDTGSQNFGAVTAPRNDTGRTIKSRAKGRPRLTKKNANQQKKQYPGTPTARDSQGNPLFTRPSDGKLVYLYCCVTGCERVHFPNVRALRQHVSAAEGYHKLLAYFNSNDHAIEICGRVAPGQEGVEEDVNNHHAEVAPMTKKLRNGVLTSTATDSDDDAAPGQPSGSRTSVSSIVQSSTSAETNRAKAQNRAYRATPIQTRSRAQTHTNTFEGYLSEDPEDSSDDDEPPRRISADHIDQHRAARPKACPAVPPPTEHGVREICAEDNRRGIERLAHDTDEPVIKEERDGSPLFVEWELVGSSRPQNAIAVAVGSGEEIVDKSLKLITDTLKTRKRSASERPTTPPPSSKRSRTEDEPRTI